MKHIVTSAPQNCPIMVTKNHAACVSMQRERPKVGVGVFVLSDCHPHCVLVGKRKSSSGEGKYGLPGGHQEFGESWVECGEREVEEETGLRMTGTRFSAVLNVVIPDENYHYVEFFVQGHVDTQHGSEPINVEPDKCDGWEWVDWDTFLPLDTVFEPLKVIREQGFNPFQ
ncbi:hypothetical protein V1264_001648 [Littorina saxatilis]